MKSKICPVCKGSKMIPRIMMNTHLPRVGYVDSSANNLVVCPRCHGEGEVFPLVDNIVLDSKPTSGSDWIEL